LFHEGDLREKKKMEMRNKELKVKFFGLRKIVKK